MRIKLVVATRLSAADFFRASATGRSLVSNKPNIVDLRLFPENREGLPKIYNQAIRECAADPAILVFAHDDLLLLDFYWASRIREGLRQFQVIGVAGNTRRLPSQPSWAFVDAQLRFDSAEHLSGVVGHGGEFPPRVLSVYGRTRKPVLLLDGLLLASESKTLLDHDLMFDERFDFHFYDMDFCRQAESKNISCGTWDISVIHQSGGSFKSEAWRSAYLRYLEKWGD